VTGEPLRLDSLIESVADGSPLDWDALQAQADAKEQRLLRHLRLVASVAEVHRTAAKEAVESTGDAAEPRDASHSRWGDLLLLEKIGEGAFGDVYRARDTWLDREVALKLLKPNIIDTVPSGRILSEGRTLARLRHPNVVTVYGAETHDGRVGLWMELVRGRTLQQAVATDGLFSASEAANIGQDVCRALAAVHAAGVVHQDVKAQNVMRESGGRLVLMDFGAGHTPLYLAPEVLRGEPPSVASDIYAVGVLLFFLVTGRYPATGSSVKELREVHARGERTRLGDLRTDVPDAFIRVVERALEPEPSRRFASANQLREVLAGLPATEQSLPTPVVRRARATWWLAAAAVVALALAFTAWRNGAQSSNAGATRYIAVLPLRSDEPNTQYFADGMTEAVQQALAQVPAVRVLSRTSVDRARSSAASLPDMARLLNADAVLEGSVNRAGDGVRINLRLINAQTDAAMWSRSFEDTQGSVTLQSRVARAVAEALSTRFAPTRAAPRQPLSPEAYDEYLRGRYEFQRQSEGSVVAALKHFQHAAELEPTYARAFSGMADCYLALGGAFAVYSEEESARLARDAADRAIELDSSLAEAFAARAMILFQFDWNFAAAEREFQRSIDLDPSLVAPHYLYADFLVSRARFDDAFQQLAAARAVDPLSPSVADNTAAAYYFRREFDSAIAEVNRASQLDPEGMSPLVGLGRVLNAMGRYREAIAQYELAARRSASDHPFFDAEIAQAEAALGERDRALSRIQRLEATIDNPRSRVTRYMIALAYARLDRDRAFEWLDREFQRRGPRVLWLRVDPRVDPLRSDPRLVGYLQRLGFQ
jgi:serine/threonine protein kinase/Tfp pilus assembly protein PilF